MSHTREDEDLRAPTGFFINLLICLGYGLLWVMTLTPEPGDEKDIVVTGLIVTVPGIIMLLLTKTLTRWVKAVTLVARVAVPLSFLAFTVEGWYWSLTRMITALVAFIVSFLAFGAQYVERVEQQ